MSNKVLDAARKLIDDGIAPAELGATQLVAAGACTAEAFQALYPEPRAFQLALLTHLFVDARDAVIRVTAGMKPGIAQLSTAFETYLDYNLTHPQLQALAQQLQFDPAGFEVLSQMEAGVALIAQSELKSAGADQPGARGKLLTAMTIYTVRAEYRAGQRLPQLRAALMDYCRLSAP